MKLKFPKYLYAHYFLIFNGYKQHLWQKKTNGGYLAHYYKKGTNKEGTVILESNNSTHNEPHIIYGWKNEDN